MKSPRLASRAALLALSIARLCASPDAADAACNLIPPAEVAYPSTMGMMTSPITTVGFPVELRLTPCDGSAGFDPTPANNQVAITFLPAGLGQPPPVMVPGGSILVSDCTVSCNRLRFTMPSTPSLAGPAAITVTVGPNTVADIGPLFQAHTVGSTCDKMPETVFQQFTILPPPNDFGDVASGAATEVVMTLDGSGSVVIPFDYRSILPLGPGEPVARLLTGTTTLDAFPGTPGVQPIDVPSSYVRSFTIDGRPLPPLLRVTDAGNQIFGATDGAVAIIRVAQTGSEGVKFDLQSTRTNGGYGPIVVPNSEYTAATSSAIPLENLRSTAETVAFARDERVEGNLNAGSGDTDTNDQVIQLIDVATFSNPTLALALSPTNNPIVGNAALDVAPGMAAFLVSEAAQNNTPLNGDGDTLDHILHAVTPTGMTLVPPGTIVANPFPGVDRKPVRIGGSLIYYRETAPGLNGVASFGGGVDIAVSPDGQYLYEVYQGVVFGLFNVLHLDPETGGTQRNVIEAHAQFLLDGATGVTVSADSRFVFIAAAGQNRLESIQVKYNPLGVNNYFRPPYNPPNGGGGVLIQGVGGVDGLTGVGHVGGSPDAKHVYALSEVQDTIVTATVDPHHGDLIYVGTLTNGVDVADMADPREIEISADGANAYVAANGSSAVHVFTRNPATGVLTPFQTLLDGAAGGPSLGGISDIAVSADGLSVYALSDADSAITIFSRNPGTGALTFVDDLTTGDGGIVELTNGKNIIVSPDGTAVYATTTFGRLLVFTRTMPGGGLVFEEVTGPTFGLPLDTGNLAISPDSEHVYQAFDGGAQIQAYARRGALRAFDTVGASLKPGLLGPNDATLAASAGVHAAFTTAGGNGPAQYYNADTDSITEIGGGIAAKKVAISEQIIAMVVAEGALGVDGNKDGDQNDDVLVVSSTDTPAAPPKIVPVQTTDVAVTDLCLDGPNDGRSCVGDLDCPEGTCRGLAVVGATEFFYKDNGENPNPPEADFNENGVVDTAVVLFVYDAGTNKLTNTGWQAYDFVVGGNLLAFRTDELEHFVDLSGNNNDGNVAMMIWNLGTGGIHNPRASVVKCELPGCEPGKPYKIQGSKVIFLTDEQFDLRDLDGDGLTTHIVVQVYDVGTANTQVVGDAGAHGTFPVATTPLGGVPPVMPTTFTDGGVVFKQVKESEVGIDINEDGDLDDVVTVVDGDSDGDGVFDSNDICTETPNADQRDTDEDGLPDKCDPNAYCGALTPAAPALAPGPALVCQKALGKQVQKVFNTWAKASRACLEKIAKGVLAGEPTGLCRGGTVNGVAVLPGDPKTALKITKAIDKVTLLATAKCPDPMLATLQACATNTFEIGACVANAAAGMALLADLAYGDVGPIVDPAALRCQKAIGKASGKYFGSVAKAMGACMDKLNAGDLVGSGDTLCFGAGTTSGITLPIDPTTAGKIQAAADKVTTALTVACPGGTAAALDACGTDATSLTDCIRCSHGRHAIAAMRAIYGPP